MLIELRAKQLDRWRIWDIWKDSHNKRKLNYESIGDQNIN